MKQKSRMDKKLAARFLQELILTAAFAVHARGEAASSTVTLSMREAIERAVQTQLTARLARAGSQEARGRALAAAASLLPQVTGSVSQVRVFKNNLAAQGFESSSFLPDPVIGPYNTFDARFVLVQKLLDFNSIWNAKAASANAQAARLAETLAAEQVASAAALAYIEDLRTIHDVHDAQANLELAQKLAVLAQHQRDAGLATGVDVARAETRVAQNRQRLVLARLGATRADIRLKRVAGLPLSGTLTLAEPGSEGTPGVMDLEKALSQAQSQRAELLILSEQVKAETYALDAAKADYLPTVSAEADYGLSGNTPDGTARTGRIGARLELPVFSGGSTRGRVMEARGRKAAVQSQYADMRLQVEEDVRLALQTLSAEADEVEASQQQVELAEKELRLAQDRYGAGVGDNVQVVTAQASLADARKARVDAQARYSEAQANLAMALGQMRTFSL